MVNVCTACFDIQKLCIFVTVCVYMFPMILILHNEYFIKAFVMEARCVFCDIGTVTVQLILTNFRLQTLDFI
jgi:hypothetical protein